MEKHISGLLIVIAVFALLIGGLVGYNMAPTKVITETETQIVYQDVIVETVIEVQAPSQLDLAIEYFLIAIEDEEVENESGTVDILGSYNFDELEVRKIYDDYSVSYYDDKTTVNFTIKLKFDDGDTRLRQTYNVSVTSEESEDTIVEVA